LAQGGVQYAFARLDGKFMAARLHLDFACHNDSLIPLKSFKPKRSIVADFSLEHKILDKVLIIGCGDIGQRVAKVYRHIGAPVCALTRHKITAEALASQGLMAYVGDLDLPEKLPALPTSESLIFYFAPPPATGEGDPRLQSFLNHITDEALPRKLIYISTSGVYGDCQGAWVTEDTPPRPSTDRARRRLAAETLLHAWETTYGIPVAILRVGGIYGPGRLPVERLRQGTPVLREQECGYTNRIHADDLATICVAAAEQGQGIYNVSDGHPSTMTDYFNRVADLCGLPRPPQIDFAGAQTRLSAEMMSYLTESRRLDNRKMLRELNVRLRYPNLSAGLAGDSIDNGATA
jgi:nucleoside-diphosphate-sugar epimerase